VQERAIKAVSGLQGKTYHERLSELKMQSLDARRMEADMVLTYKILSDCDTKFHEQWFELAADRRPTRQSSGVSNLLARRSNHEYRREFFSNRVVEKWNRLPDTVKAAPSAGAFKNRYRHHLETSVARRPEPAPARQR
jgi:hypothetical protein